MNGAARIPGGPPVGLAAAALLYWGYVVGPFALGIALLLAVLLELPRFAGARATVPTAKLARVFDFGLLLAFAGVGVLAVDVPVATAVKQALHWLPLALAPFVVLQSWNTPVGIDLKALWWQSQRRRPPPMPPFPVDFRWLYLPVVLIAAGAASEPGLTYYGALGVFTAWALASARVPRTSHVAWGLCLALALGLGHVAHRGLATAQSALARLAVDVLSAGDDTDPYNRRTAIGDVGEIKLSDAIMLRVSAPDGVPPGYLHRATYDVYTAGAWSASARLAVVPPLRDGVWSVAGGGGDSEAAGQDPTTQDSIGRGPLAELRLSARHDGGRAVLAAPFGAVRVTSSDITSLRRSALGVLEQSAADSGVVNYRLEYHPGVPIAADPGARDLAIPVAEEATLLTIRDSLELPNQATPGQRVGIVERWFGRGFSYALYQADQPVDGSALSRFLTEHRSGHCEYYASATVLLLRATGVPARYVTGFVVQEWSDLEEAWVVRRRHAHAWARAWVDGRWVDVDTTPSNWFSAEQAEASMFQPLLDALDWALFRFRQWRNNPERAATVPWLVGLGVVVLIGLGIRAGRRLRFAATGRGPGALGTNDERSAGSAGWRRLESALATRGCPRSRSELPTHWVERVAALPGMAQAAGELDALVAWHYRLRFGPGGTSDGGDDRDFAAAVDDWVATLPDVPLSSEVGTAR